MTPLRKKDKVFLAIVLPLAVVAGYVWGWRMPTAARRAELAREWARLPSPEDFPHERARLARAVKEAEEARAALAAETPPSTAVTGNPEETGAERRAALLAVLREAGVRVVSVAPYAERASAARGDAVLRATGVRPHPEALEMVLEGSYPGIQAVFRSLEARLAPVIPERVSLDDGTGNASRWKVMVWL